MDIYNNKVICILGMHRSGTSMITRILNITGLYIGEQNNLVPGKISNKKGHWEHKTVLEINKEILLLLGGSTFDIPNFPKDWEDDERFRVLEERARDFVNEMNEKSSVWAFKEPRTCITLPFWQKIIPDMTYIIPVRNPMNVVLSLRKRNDYSLMAGCYIWLKYWNSILQYTYGKKRIFTIQENYFASWKRELEKITEFLNYKNFSFEGKEQLIDNFISPDLIHNNDKKFSFVDCDDHDSFCPQIVVDYIMKDFSEILKTELTKDRKKEKEMQKMIRENNDLKKKLESVNEKKYFCKNNITLMFKNFKKAFVYFKNGIKFVMFSPDKFFKKYFLKNKDKLIMTLLVRDEADIVKENIEFHLKKGVDFIIATDNGSVDGTREILEEYQDKGVLYLINEPSQDYSQAIWVNRMVDLAFNKFGASYVFSCDADEFWFPKSGNVKTEISKTEKRVLKVKLLNFLLVDRGGKESFPSDTQYAVVKPVKTNNYKEDSKYENMYLFQYPPKVIVKENLNFMQGNHDVLNVEEDDKGLSQDLIIYHYPLRGKNHFIQKVKNGGSSYEANKKLKKNIGWHWRMWFNSYKEGKIEEEYKKLILSKKKLNSLLEKGIVKNINNLF